MSSLSVGLFYTKCILQIIYTNSLTNNNKEEEVKSRRERAAQLIEMSSSPSTKPLEHPHKNTTRFTVYTILFSVQTYSVL